MESIKDPSFPVRAGLKLETYFLIPKHLRFQIKRKQHVEIGKEKKKKKKGCTLEHTMQLNCAVHCFLQCLPVQGPPQHKSNTHCKKKISHNEAKASIT